MLPQAEIYLRLADNSEKSRLGCETLLRRQLAADLASQERRFFRTNGEPHFPTSLLESWQDEEKQPCVKCDKYHLYDKSLQAPWLFSSPSWSCASHAFP